MQLHVYVEKSKLNWIVSVVTRAFEDSKCEVPQMKQLFENDDKMMTLKLDTPYKVPETIINTMKKLFMREGWKHGASVKEMVNGSERYSFLRRPPHIELFGSETDMQNLCMIVDDAYVLHGHEQPQVEMIQRTSDGKWYLDVKTKRIPEDVYSSIWEMIKQNRNK